MRGRPPRQAQARNPSAPRKVKAGPRTTNAVPPNSARVDLTLIKHPLAFRWASAISEDEWIAYRTGMETVRNTGIGFMLGGGFAMAAFTGRWRDTKDIDFYILPSDRDKVVAALTRAGFKDYFEQRPYDRKWIYRSVREEVVIDIIWAMANQRAAVDASWFTRAEELTLRSQKVQVVPLEEFIWAKLYILQRDHCDWTDVFNVVYANGPSIEWDHLMGRLGEDLNLLRGMLSVYAWLCPKKVRELPQDLWSKLGIPAPAPDDPAPSYDRPRLLDSRGWFAGTLEEGSKLEV